MSGCKYESGNSELSLPFASDAGVPFASVLPRHPWATKFTSARGIRRRSLIAFRVFCANQRMLQTKAGGYRSKTWILPRASKILKETLAS
jgi:hypothetical protein